MTLYFYADETEFELDNHDGQPINLYGYGVLITRYRVEETDVIVEALHQLRQDPDIHKKPFSNADYQNIDRGYFHACEDSKNAHSHLCTTIRKYIQGKFRYEYDEKSKFSDILTRTCLELTYKNEPIEIVFEGREDFQEFHVKEWIENFYRCIETILVQPPDIPAYFPDITTKVSNKKNAGLKVADFILWAINRTKKKNPDPKWYNRLEFTFISDGKFNIKDKLYTGGQCLLKEGLERKYPNFRYPASYLNFQKLPNSFLDLLDLYLFIEYQLLKVNCTAIPTHILHLRDDLINAVINFDFPNQFNQEHQKIIQKVASIYIRLFDTLPVYLDLAETDCNQWSKFLLSRRFASQLLFQEDAEVQRFCYSLVEYKRRSLQRHRENLFNSIPSLRLGTR